MEDQGRYDQPETCPSREERKEGLGLALKWCTKRVFLGHIEGHCSRQVAD
jgi:hypothetical protein